MAGFGALLTFGREPAIRVHHLYLVLVACTYPSAVMPNHLAAKRASSEAARLV